MIIVEGWIRFAPGQLEAVREGARALVEATRAEKGCLSYALSADLAEPDLMRISEIWEDEDSMKAHGKAPHLAAFAGQLAGKAAGMSVKGYSGAFMRTLMGS